MQQIDEALVGHVIVRRGGRVVAVPVVEAGWLDEIGAGVVGEVIEVDRSPEVPTYRVWRAAATEAAETEAAGTEAAG